MLIAGQEGAGKTTVTRALLPYLHAGAVIDGEDLGRVNPWVYDDAFRDLHRRNVAALVTNFWAAGYANVVAGSFFGTLPEYRAFRSLLGDVTELLVVELQVDKAVRDGRRATRSKVTTQAWRDAVDLAERPDDSLRRADDREGFRYLAVDTTSLDVEATVARVTAAAPGMFRHQGG
jgi:hypothetical protein